MTCFGRPADGLLIFRFGVVKLPEAESLTNGDIWERIQSELLAISEAHYERYFRQPLEFD